MCCPHLDGQQPRTAARSRIGVGPAPFVAGPGPHPQEGLDRPGPRRAIEATRGARQGGGEAGGHGAQGVVGGHGGGGPGQELVGVPPGREWRRGRLRCPPPPRAVEKTVSKAAASSGRVEIAGAAAIPSQPRPSAQAEGERRSQTSRAVSAGRRSG